MKHSNLLNRIGLVVTCFGAALGNTSVGLLLTLVGLLASLPRLRFKLRAWDPFHWLFVVLIAVMVASAVVSPVPRVASLLTLGFALVTVGFVFGATWLAGEWEFVNRRLLPALVLGSVLSYAYALWSYFGRHLDRAAAPFVGCNGLGTLVILAGWTSLGYLGTLKFKWRRPALVAYFSLAVAALAVTFSRGAWFGFLGGLVIFGLLNQGVRRWVLVAMAAIAAVVAAAAPLRDRFISAFQLSASGGRLYIWKGALAMFKDHPVFGVGAGVFMHVSARYAPPGDPYPVAAYAHNLFQQVLAEFGVVGAAVFVAILGRVLYCAWKLARTGKPLYQGLFAAFVGVLIHQQVDIPVWGLEVGGLFWLTTTLVVTAFHAEGLAGPRSLPPGASTGASVREAAAAGGS
ncbi:MAG: O-antigen ligase family protein [Bacteroidota bacterium]